MKILFNRKELAQSIDYCMTCIEKKNTMPILTNILLETESDSIRLLSTNLDTSVIARIRPLEIDGIGMIAIPAKHISDITKVSKGEIIEFDYDEEHSLLNVKADRSKYSIPCADYNDFPTIPEDSIEGSSVEVVKLTSLFKKLQFSMTETNINKSYAGVLITRVEEDESCKIEMATTDIHRISVLSLKNLDVAIPALNEGLVVLGKNFAEIHKIFIDKENVRMEVTEGKILVKSDEITFICRLLKNEFPNYKSVTGTEETLLEKPYTVINRRELIDGLKRVIALCTEEKIWATKFHFKGNVLTLSANAEFGGNSTDEVILEKPFDEEKTIGVNARYLLDVLSVIDSPDVHIVVEEGLRPLTIIEKSDDFFYTHMVMPLRI